MTHEDSRAPGEHFRLCVTALFLLLHLDAVGFFPADSDCDLLSGKDASDGVVIASLLVRHLESWSVSNIALLREFVAKCKKAKSRIDITILRHFFVFFTPP